MRKRIRFPLLIATVAAIVTLAVLSTGLMTETVPKKNLLINAESKPKIYRSTKQANELKPLAKSTPSKNLDGQPWYDYISNTSIADTNPPAFFETNNGRLVRSESLRAIFDYFLSLDGELPLEKIREALIGYATTELSPAQSDEVLSTFDQYFNYLQTIHADQENLDPQLSLADKFEWIKSQRRQILGTDLAQSYFQYEENYDEYSLAKLDITNDTSLTISEKQQAIARLTQQLPQELRERERQDTAIKQAIETDREMQSRLTPNELYQTRLQRYGFETTERLTALDNSRDTWHERYQQYAQEAESIRSSHLAIMDKNTAIDQLRQSHFSESELVRVAALDKIAEYE
ncbi:MAG: hypothetical protein MI976_12985 [Pseudomonadales bacterium]|nr:hypothetical protein [Pseudomonadales bacterium]